MTSSTNNTTTKQFFDLYIKGIGYVNRIREVKPAKGSPYLCCTIAALRGNVEDPEYTYFECNVIGEKAKELIARCKNASEANKKILVRFCLSDVYADTFVYAKEEKKGQTGVSLKARLIKISSIKINGELKYTEPKKHSDSSKTSPLNDEENAA